MESQDYTQSVLALVKKRQNEFRMKYWIFTIIFFVTPIVVLWFNLPMVQININLFLLGVYIYAWIRLVTGEIKRANEHRDAYTELEIRLLSNLSEEELSESYHQVINDFNLSGKEASFIREVFDFLKARYSPE